MHIYLPRKIVPIHREKHDSPFFFLAGPVRGGGDWQQEFSLKLNKARTDCSVALPMIRKDLGQLKEHVAQDNFRHTPNRQLDWETEYLLEAGLGKKPGCVVFWLEKESETEPHPGPEPYSMDTRGELGEWRTRLELQNARVVFGGNPEWHGFSQVERNIQRQIKDPEFRIITDMDDLVKEALKVAYK